MSAKLLEFYAVTINQKGITYFIMDGKESKFTLSANDIQTIYHTTGIEAKIMKGEILSGAVTSMVARKCNNTALTLS